MNHEITFDFLKTLYAIAWADNKIVEQEIAVLKQLQESAELTASEKEKIEKFLSKAISANDIRGIDFSKFSHEQKAFLLTMAIAVSNADNEISQSESNLISILKDLLNLQNFHISAIAEDVGKSLLLYGDAAAPY